MVDFIESQGNTTEEEARSKVRDFVHDPHLKFHFGNPNDLKSICKMGILSHAFAERIGFNIGENLGVRPGLSVRSISIQDRGKNLTEAEAQALSQKDKESYAFGRTFTPEQLRDWWVKRFCEFRHDIGFLLRNDIKIRPNETPHVNESLVPLRVRPSKIEGIFVVERDELFQTVVLRRSLARQENSGYTASAYSFAKGFLREYFGEETIEPLNNQPRIKDLENTIWQLYEQNRYNNRIPLRSALPRTFGAK